MISVRHDNPAGRALRLIGELPDEVDAEALGRHLWPLPPMPTQGWAAYLAWRAEVSRVRVTPRVPACAQKAVKARGAAVRVLPPRSVAVIDPERAAKASRLLSRLQQQGLVEAAGGPALADWYLTSAAARGHESALHLTMLDRPESGDIPAILRLILAMVANPPGSVADLLGARPSGRKRATYRAACDLGVIIPPSRRRLTDAGRALVESWSLQPGPTEPPCP